MAATPDNPPAEFTWQAHPADERRGAAVLGSLIIVAAAAAILFSFESYAWSAAAVVVLIAALNRFYFRSRFRIDPEGITARYPFRSQRCRWAEVRRFMVDEHGGYLSTRARRSWLDAYRGVHILFGHERPEVIKRIRAHLPREDRP
jgi:hypothetical protein